jgi:type IV pilus assembly protein PilW
MNSCTPRQPRLNRGHTLIELMTAIVIGMLLVLAAFQVMASFEGNKRSSTAMNDALQSGSYGLYEIDKLVRSAGTGISRYGAIAGFGCLLNYTPALSATTVSGGSAPALPTPFATTVGGTTGIKVRLAPAIVFPGASTVEAGSGTTGSDALLLMLGGAGYGEVPIPITEASGPTVDSTVGFSAGQWVLVGPSGISQCLITQVAAGYTFSASNVVLPLSATTVGAKSVAALDYAVGLGGGTAANFVMYGVNPADDSLYSFDMLNGDGATAQKVSDDVVLIRAVYGVDPTNSGTLTWTLPAAGAVVGGVTYSFSPAGLLDGSAGANTALKSIRAIRVAVVVRAPLFEKSASNLSATSIPLFSSIPAAQQANAVSTTWAVPTLKNYRYRELETTIPIRNGFF